MNKARCVLSSTAITRPHHLSGIFAAIERLVDDDELTSADKIARMRTDDRPPAPS